jgi:chain length determinant protein EpsF
MTSARRLLAVLAGRKLIVLLTLALTLTAALVAGTLLPERYKATASVIVDSRGSDPISGLVMSSALIPGYIATQVDIIGSRNVAEKVVKRLKLAASPAARTQFETQAKGEGSIEVWLAELLLKRLDVRPSRESSVIDIAFYGTDPVAAAQAANAFAQAYVDTNLELRVEPARQTKEWYAERTRGLRDDLESAQGRLSKFQREKGIVAADERLDTENSRLEQLSLQLSQVQSQTADALARQRQARQFRDQRSPTDSIPEVLANPLVQTLKSESSRLERKLQELSSQYGANHPQVQAASAELKTLREKLREEMAGVVQGIDNAAQVAQRRESELRAAVQAQKARVLQIKRQREELAVLAREAENAERTFDTTTQRMAQTNLESQANYTNVAVLTPAVPPRERDFPRWPTILTLGTVLGLLLGGAFALLAEWLDPRVRTAEDLERVLDAPVLAQLRTPRRKRRWFGAVRWWPRRTPRAAAEGSA